jgi:putative toxin-antitoxin system antitoxin component (TIGR02293 family)
MSHSPFSPQGTHRRVAKRKAIATRKRAFSGVADASFVPESGPRQGMVVFATAAGKTAPAASNASNFGKLSYLGVYHASPLQRISLIKQGVPASEVKLLFADLHIAQGVGFKALNLSTATVNKKAKTGDLLSSDESERVIGLAKLVGQREAMVEESGEPSGFDARTWIARWLTEPLPAFGRARPVDLIDTMEGQGLVSSALAKLQSGAYA